MDVRVSVVVPTYKRLDLLVRCLDALLHQDFDPGAYEVIIVDDAADERTRELVETFEGKPGDEQDELGWLVHPTLEAGVGLVSGSGKVAVQQAEATMVSTIQVAQPRLRYLQVDGIHGPAAARNCGWRAARGEMIAFTDDDCVPAQDWLQKGVAALEGGAAGVSGRMEVPLPDHPTDYEMEFRGLERSEFITANCFYLRSLLKQVRGFDENFKMAWREDSDLYFRALRSGAKLVIEPEAVVVHPVRKASWGVSIGQQRKSMYNALAYKKHPELYRQKLQSSPPWHYYAILFGLLLSLAGVVSGISLVSLAGTGGWSLLTLRFFLQRLQGKSRAPAHVIEMLVTSMLIPPLCIYWRLRGAIKYRVLFL